MIGRGDSPHGEAIRRHSPLIVARDLLTGDAVPDAKARVVELELTDDQELLREIHGAVH